MAILVNYAVPSISVHYFNSDNDVVLGLVQFAFFFVFATVALSFVCDHYYPIIE